MPSISQLSSIREEATIEVKGLAIAVTYAPNQLTMQRMAELQRRAQAEDVEAIAEIVTEILDRWDVEGPLFSDPDDPDEEPEQLVDAGEVIPIKPEMIAALPAFFVLELSNQLQELVVNGPKPTRGTSRSRKR